MEVKTYESFSIPECIKKIKSELGKEVIILSTKEKSIKDPSSGDIKSLFQINAVPIINKKNKQKEARSLRSKNIQKYTFPNSENKSQKSLQNYKIEPDMDDMKVSKLSPKIDDMGHQDIQSIKLELEKIKKNMTYLSKTQFNYDLQEIKVLLHDLIKSKNSSYFSKKTPFITDIVIKLRAAGVSEVFVTELCQVLEKLEHDVKDNKFSEEKLIKLYLDTAIRYFFMRLKTYNFIETPPEQKQKIACFLGPSGVGKTTTLLKIAASIRDVKKEDVLIVSLDSFRLAASEQLRIYSNILDFKFIESQNLLDLNDHIAKHSNYKWILIDTCGLHPRSFDQNEFLKTLNSLPLPIDYHLVMSCSMKQRDLNETVNNFKYLGLESLLFTKLDESWAFGEIVNTSLQSGIPLSFFSSGPNIPEDIEIATKETIIERIFKI